LPRRHWRRKETSIGRDNMKGTPITEPQLIILCVSGIEKP
jgi:hypothetical protein